MPYDEFVKLPDEERFHPDMKDNLVIDAWIFAYVDDMLCGGIETKARDVFKLIATRWKFKNDPAPPARFIGIQQYMSSNGLFWSQYALAESLDVDLKGKKILPQPLPRNLTMLTQRIEESRKVSRSEHTRYRSLLGSLSFLQHSRPDLLYAISYLARWNQGPTEVGLQALVHACRFTKKYARMGILFPRCSRRRESINDLPPRIKNPEQGHLGQSREITGEELEEENDPHGLDIRLA